MGPTCTWASFLCLVDKWNWKPLVPTKRIFGQDPELTRTSKSEVSRGTGRISLPRRFTHLPPNSKPYSHQHCHSLVSLASRSIGASLSLMNGTTSPSSLPHGVVDQEEKGWRASSRRFGQAAVRQASGCGGYYGGIRRLLLSKDAELG